MTVKAMAKALDTSTMTIYRRLKRNGINIDDLRDDATGELTTAGASTIAALFRTTATTDDEQAAQQIVTDTVTGDATDDDLTGSTGSTGSGSTVAVLQAKLDGAQALIDMLTDERDDLRRQLAQVTAALQAEQADRQRERLMLTGGDGGQHDDLRRGWFRRLFGGR